MRITGVTFAARKTRRAKYIIVPVVVLLFILLLATVILSVYKSWNILHPEKKTIDAFSSNIVPEYRSVTFRGADSTILLEGWLFESKHSDRAVILVHSYKSNRLEFGVETVDMIKGFLSNGYNVLVFDLRNSGESGGKDFTFGHNEKEDVKAAIKYIRNQGSKHVTLLGFSTGASASILAAAESTGANGTPLVDAVIADSPYSDLKTYLNSDLDKWTKLPPFPFNRTTALAIGVAGGIRYEDASPVNAITAENTPRLMLIHSRNDDFIPIINSIELYQKYSGLNPSGAEFWQTEDQGHVRAYMNDKDEYMSRIFSFLSKVYPED
jgi:dipeptidyl aminopeptidase/acylaminoacyl peptidase